ncbi:TetR family transcriptional regulator [Corynebacterium poyangense]|uniref:TetR family transcriptional regulator n=1 Tax=Corynebacterium poyangense TaxID=2684405 RepID=A0A7H0SKY5_9CORY|nr:TetR/AcrR family transcriptional regulator [Corynebacterium poyangense]MBZ8177293.1 TetR family transcriptional regulator [Corynebacterium poyangense]QNQ89210.1 TetR family transcriptional regulator [Corynebacterium poyangense]
MGRSDINYQELHKAFWRLLDQERQQPYKRISVQALTCEAGCNRGTFYYHFHDIEDFYDDILTQVFDDNLVSTVVEIISGEQSVEEGIPNINHFDQAVTKIGQLLNSSVSSHFRPRITKVITQNWQSKLGINPTVAEDASDIAVKQAISEFILGGILSMWAWRARQTPPPPLESLARPEFIGSIAELMRQLRK